MKKLFIYLNRILNDRFRFGSSNVKHLKLIFNIKFKLLAMLILTAHREKWALTRELC